MPDLHLQNSDLDPIPEPFIDRAREAKQGKEEGARRTWDIVKENQSHIYNKMLQVRLIYLNNVHRTTSEEDLKKEAEIQVDSEMSAITQVLMEGGYEYARQKTAQGFLAGMVLSAICCAILGGIILTFILV